MPNLITTLVVLSVLVGIGGAAFLVFRSPGFWADVAKEFATKAMPQIWAVLSKRLPEDQEAAWREAEKSGHGDEWRRKRRGAPPKG